MKGWQDCPLKGTEMGSIGAERERQRETGNARGKRERERETGNAKSRAVPCQGIGD